MVICSHYFPAELLRTTVAARAGRQSKSSKNGTNRANLAKDGVDSFLQLRVTIMDSGPMISNQLDIANSLLAQETRGKRQVLFMVQ